MVDQADTGWLLANVTELEFLLPPDPSHQNITLKGGLLLILEQ